MPDLVSESPPEPLARHGHETTDVSFTAISFFALGLALMVGLVLAFVGKVFWNMESVAEITDAPIHPGEGVTIFRRPKLQSRPSDDLDRMRRSEEQRMSSYGWIDRKQGIARIPAERAITILAERGIPEPVGPPPAAPKERTP